ncbi:MAG: hypothetical protein ACE5FI_10085 [Anaerolineales bacterium]
MSSNALFKGLVFNESGVPAEVTIIGDEAHYVIDDAGFKRHVQAERIDRTVLHRLREQILANKDFVTESAMKMLGKDDLFSKAMIDSSIKNLDEHMDKLIHSGMPTGAQQWLGMLGFRITVDYHGDVIALEQPGGIAPDGGY